MESNEEAYERIATVLVDSAEQNWSCLRLEGFILNKNLSAVTSIQTDEKGVDSNIPLGLKIFEIQEAALLLRKNLVEATGQRIWGLTFTLYPDGKFNLEYDYNKPEGYEESDEVITGDEINASLKAAFGNSNQS